MAVAAPEVQTVPNVKPMILVIAPRAPAQAVRFEPSVSSAPIVPPAEPMRMVAVTQPAPAAIVVPPPQLTAIESPAPAPARVVAKAEAPVIPTYEAPARIAIIEPQLRTTPIPAPVAVAPVPQPALMVSRAEISPPVRTAPIPAPAQLANAAPAGTMKVAARARVEIANGNGVAGMAAWIRGYLHAQGLKQPMRLQNARPYNTATTTVQYRDGFAGAAIAISHKLPGGAAIEHGLNPGHGFDVRVVLGHDIRSEVACSSRCPTFRDDTAIVASLAR
jgi:hypothetical protein